MSAGIRSTCAASATTSARRSSSRRRRSRASGTSRIAPTAPRRWRGGSRRWRPAASAGSGSTATSGTAPRTASSDPDGHRIELFYESERYTAPPEIKPALKNQPHRYPGRGVGVRHLDHVNFLAVDPGENRVFCEQYLGLRLTEQIVLDNGDEAGVWLASSQKSYDLTYTRDVTGTHGRLHHIAFFVDQREDVLRAADIFLEHGIVMESGPHKHAIQQTFFLYTYEPGGNRIEVCAGGFLILAPDHEPVVWTQAERAKGQAWGMQTVASFHIKGTPPGARGGSASCPCRTLSRSPPLARASWCAAATTCTCTSSPTSPSGASTTSRSRSASSSSGWRASCSSRTTRRPRSAPRSCRAAVPGIHALGAISLNAGVGGLNAQAVEIAARGGARIVWLPTVDSENEAERGRPQAGQAAGLAQDPGRVHRRRRRRRARAADAGRPRARARGRRAARSRAGDRAPRPGRDPHARSTPLWPPGSRTSS